MENNFITNYADHSDFQCQIRNNFITDYADFTDFSDYIKNNFTSDSADYVHFKDYIKNSYTTDCTDFRDYIKVMSPLTTLTALIFKITWEIHFQKCVFKNDDNWQDILETA